MSVLSKKEASLELVKAILSKDNRLHLTVDNKKEYAFDYCYSQLCSMCNLLELCRSSSIPQLYMLILNYLKAYLKEQPELFL